jgi:hypothetical protein
LGCEQKKHTKFAKCPLANAFGFGLINDHHMISFMGKKNEPHSIIGLLFLKIIKSYQFNNLEHT